MMWRWCVLFKMQAMDYMAMLLAALTAALSTSVVYVGSKATSQEDSTALSVDMATMTGMVTFISMLIAQHPEWVV